MSRSIVVKSFAELASVLDLGGVLDESNTEIVEEPSALSAPQETTADLTTLLDELEAASAMLATVVRQDQEARALALRDLEQYDALVAGQREAERAADRAQQVRREAEALVTHAFTGEARDAAKRVSAIAVQVETTAMRLAEQRRQEAERLAAQLDLEWLLAERRREEEAKKARAAEAERARRLSGALTQAKAALDAGRHAEAKELLGPVANEFPDNSEVSSLTKMIAQRELAVKVAAAEEALWAARREYRRDPAAVVACLEALDVEGLPEPLARQIFGEWARSCARVCRANGTAEPLRYAPDPGRGAVIARESSTENYVVVSVLGMGPGWQKGHVVGERQVRRARPLR